MIKLKGSALDLSNEQIHTFFLGSGILFFLIMVLVSDGYFHYDEHYQIIEFANYKLGNAARGDLAWEFEAHIRSGLQPAIAYFFLKLFAFVGVKNPYLLSLFLRLVSGFLLLFVIRRFVLASSNLIPPSNRIFYYCLSYSIYFLPYLNVRFSSENWSGAFLLLSLALVYSDKDLIGRWSTFALGIFMGISVLLRFQSGFFVLSMLLWLATIAKLKFSKLFNVLVGVLMMMSLGILMDFWLYGKFVFTIYNYFETNILHGVASDFGVSPWYAIFSYILLPAGLYGLPILISLTLLLIFDPKDVTIWVLLPFIVVHTIIPHKELRFLFPLINLIPFVILRGLGMLDIAALKLQKVKTSICTLIFIFNCLAFCYLVVTGAGRDNVVLTAFLERNFKNKNVTVYYSGVHNPYGEWASPKNTFYSNRNIELHEINSLDALENQHIASPRACFLVIKPDDATGEEAAIILKKCKLKLVYQTDNPFGISLPRFWENLNSSQALSLYQFN